MVQNFAFCRRSEPHDVHFAVLDGFEISDELGDGNVPGLLNPSPTIDGGAPTGVCAVPARGACCIPIPPPIVPGEPIPGMRPGDCVPPGAEPPDILSSDFIISKTTLIARNSNAEYATT